MTSLRLMSYNIRYAALDQGCRDWSARCDAVASAVWWNRPDVVGLQECWLGQLDDLRERLDGFRWVGEPHRNGEHTPIGYRADRFRPLETGSFWLSESGEPGIPGWDASVPRVATYARLRDVSTRRAFVVCSVHLDHERDKARIEGARLVVDRMTELTDDSPLVLVGDFNAPTDSPSCDVVRSAGLVDTREIARAQHGPRATYTGWESITDGRTIDHLFVPEGTSVDSHGTCPTTDAEGAPASDHLPVVAELSLPT